MKKGIFLYIVLLLCKLPAAAQQAVADTSYYNCTWQEFYQIPALYAVIDLLHPDYQLLDAAIFHATNEALETEHYPIYTYHKALHEAARLHSHLMIELDFYGHYNSKNTYYYFPLDRVRDFDKKIPLIAENIAEYPLIKSASTYCPEKSPDGDFIYRNCRNQTLLMPYTYLEYARVLANNWMNSPSHKQNLVNPDFKYLGCAARFSKNPYKTRQLPFARATQNMGGYLR